MGNNTSTNKEKLKSYFQSGFRPTQEHFEALIDALLVKEGNTVPVPSNYMLDLKGPIMYSSTEDSGEILFGPPVLNSQDPNDSANCDGFIIRYDKVFFEDSQDTSKFYDALVFEKKDINNNLPEGGIAFVNTGSNHQDKKTAMVIRGHGNVGIGTENPDTATLLHITSNKSGTTNLRLEAGNENANADYIPMLRILRDQGSTGVNMGFNMPKKPKENIVFSIGSRHNGTNSPKKAIVIDTKHGNVGIGNKPTSGEPALDVFGAIKCPGLEPGTIMYGRTNVSGTPIGDGFRIRYDNNFFNKDDDALIFEKTDGSDPFPDGGIAFVNTGNKGEQKLSMAIRGTGHVGIGAPDPSEKLEISDGSILVKTAPFGDIRVQRPNGGAVSMGVTDNSTEAFLSSAGELKFLTAADDTHPKMFIKTGGHVGIGLVPDEAYTLDVNGDINFSGDIFRAGVPMSALTPWTRDDNNDLYYMDGNVGIGTETPAEALEVKGTVKADQLITDSIRPLDGWQPKEKLLAFDPQGDANFGRSVAIDGEWALVGEYREGGEGPGTVGSVYLFRLKDGECLPKDQLQSFNPKQGDCFGCSVAISGNWILVGADHENVEVEDEQNGLSIAYSAGSAYLFQLEYNQGSKQWECNPKEKFQASNPQQWGGFGCSVALSGDRALVGAGREHIDGKSNAGSAYLFQLKDGKWELEEKFQAPNPQQNAYFGGSVAIDGDRVLVGVSREKIGESNRAGSAYLFQLKDGKWELEEKFQSSNPQQNAYFGAVAIDGDRVLVGAPGDTEPIGGTLEALGGAYLFQLKDGQWVQEEKLQPSTPQAGANFGVSVALSGDRALVGAHYENIELSTTLFSTGSAYLFQLKDGEWIQEEKFQASDPRGYAYFGQSIAIDGDWALVGAHNEEIGTSYGAGSAYPYQLTPFGITTGKLEVNGAVNATTIHTSGKAGIGTPNPKATLHVNGDYYGKGNLWLHAYQGDGRNGSAYLQARDTSGSSSIGMLLRTQENGDDINAVWITPDGKVGIGTPPSSSLEVRTTLGASDHGVVISQGSSGGNGGSGRLYFENSGQPHNSFAILKINDKLVFNGDATAGSDSGEEFMNITKTGNVSIAGKVSSYEGSVQKDFAIGYYEEISLADETDNVSYVEIVTPIHKDHNANYHIKIEGYYGEGFDPPNYYFLDYECIGGVRAHDDDIVQKTEQYNQELPEEGDTSQPYVISQSYNEDRYVVIKIQFLNVITEIGLSASARLFNRNSGEITYYNTNDEAISNMGDYTPPAAFNLIEVADGATNVFVLPEFSWSPHEEESVTYTLFLDTTAPPGEYADNLTGTTYVVTQPLLHETQYHWKVEAKDPAGNTTPSATYSFITTSNMPPADFTLTEVANGATDVGTLPAFSWSESEDPEGFPVTYDLLLDTNNPPTAEYAQDIIGNSYEATQRLSLYEWYYWQVVAKDAAGSSTGSNIHHFKTGLNFRSVATTGDVFSKRENHTTVEFQNKLWVIGGKDGSPANDIWWSANGVEWTKVTDATFKDAALHIAAVVGNEIWVMGIINGVPTLWYSSDGISWDSAEGGGADIEIAIILVQEYATFSPDNNQLWLIGGKVHPGEGEQYLSNILGIGRVGNNLLMLDIPPLFSERAGHTATLFKNNKLWIIGGESDEGYKNDIWSGEYNDATDEITWKKATQDAAFSPRAGHTTVVFDDKLWVIGGIGPNEEGDTEPRNDIWYSKNGTDWTKAADAPFPARAEHTTVEFKDELWLIGGRSSGGTENDIWVMS